MRRVQSNKLLMSKWTAVSPVNKEKHFLVTRLNLLSIELEAVYTQHKINLPLQDLADASQWRQGWH
jgi:tryptophan-rich hypothetical protein